MAVHLSSRRPLGFTLIELLVAITILSLIALLSWRGLDGMVRSQQITRERADQLVVMQNALSQWSADLDAIMPLDNVEPLNWDGQVMRITRRSSQQLEQGALVVAWALRSSNGANQWLRWQSPPVRTRAEWNAAWQTAAQWARTPSSSELQRETQLFPLSGWQLFYFYDGAWANALSTNITRPSSMVPPSASTASSKVPEGIRLQLQLPSGPAVSGQITKDWVNPTHGGGKS